MTWTYEALANWARDPGAQLVLETSGSTGIPKGVILNASALQASAQASLDRLGGPGQWVLALPTNRIGGIGVLTRSLLAGIPPVDLARDADGDIGVAVRQLRAERTYISLVPTQLHRMIRDGFGPSLASFDAVLIGGARIDQTLAQQADEHGIRIVRTYGMTETSGGCVYDGRPLDGVTVTLDADGRIGLDGPVLMEGYVGQEAHDGVLWTNDRGQFDAEGRLRVLGRIDDIAISGGVNIPLPAVEEAVAGLEGVQRAAVVAVTDAEWGQRVVACIVPQPAVCLDHLRLEALRDGVTEAGLPRTWAPRQVLLCDSLPELPGGKVDTMTLRQRASLAR